MHFISEIFTLLTPSIQSPSTTIQMGYDFLFGNSEIRISQSLAATNEVQYFYCCQPPYMIYL